MGYILLATLLLPAATTPFAYLVGRRDVRGVVFLIALVAAADFSLVLASIPEILNSPDHRYAESYYWIPALHSPFTLFVDGISLSLIIITLTLILAATIFSLNYMREREGLPEYYALLSLLCVGLVGVFMASNLMFFYFCWEMMLIPSYFIIGGWGYREPYKAAFKFFIFTHAGAVFVLLGIGAVFMVTGNLDMFQAQVALTTARPDIARWILLSFTAGFAVKMAVVPVHMWLPDAHSEAPAPMSALLSGVIISAGAYAILRLSLMTVFTGLASADFGFQFLHGLTVFGVASAFFGSLIALVENDIKRIIAYSSIAHMGYILFGISMFPCREAMIGTVLHIVNHAVSKGLLFLTAGALMKQLETRDIREMGGLAGQMPITAAASTAAALSIAGTPPFACFISEFIMFVGAFQAMSYDGFYLIPTSLMLIATVFSVAYSLRYVTNIFLGPKKFERAEEVPSSMKMTMVALTALVIILGIWPGPFLQLIATSFA